MRLDAADSSWEWVYVPQELQSTYGTGVVADIGGAYVAGFYDAGFYANEAAPQWGDHHLELRGEANSFVARHDANGSILWARRYGDGGRISVSGLARGLDGSLYVVGTMGPGIATLEDARWNLGEGTLTASAQSAFIARLDTTGSVVWARLIARAAQANEVAVDAAGHVYVAGGTADASEPGASGDAYLAAFSANGEPLWRRTVAQGISSSAEGLAVTPYGVCVVGLVRADEGSSVEKTDKWLHRVSRGFAAGYSRTGERLWSHAPTASQRDPAHPARSRGGGPFSISVYLYAAAADKSGACYAAGGFAGVLGFGSDTLTSEVDPSGIDVPWGYTDAVVLKYDRHGHAEWGRQGVGGPNSDFVEAIAVTPEGRIVVAGDFMGSGAFGKFSLAVPTREPRASGGRYITAPRGIFIASLSPAGDVASAVQNMPEETSRPTGIAVSQGGALYVTGMQERNAIYGRIDAPSRGRNAFLARLSGF